MIPILYNSTETDFTTQGLGALADAISCRVTEERNGIYELEMEYPQTGIHFEDIRNENIIMAIPSPYRAAQPFRIYRVTKPLNGNVTVYASHISYDLNKIPVSPCQASGVTAALEAIKAGMEIDNNFQFWTDKTTAAAFALSVPTACRSTLGGQQGSILDVYGGEYEWDRFTVRLHNKRGDDSGVVIRYGKNLTGLNHEGDISSLVTGICPYWFSDGTLVMCDPPIIYREGLTTQSAIPVDFTQQFEEAPTAKQLQEAAESYIKNNDVGEPTVSLDVEFIQLEQMSGFEGMALLEKCDLCDTVTVQYEQAGIDVEAEIVSIQTDVLLERYEKMQVGSIRANIAQTIADQQAQITQNKQDTVTFLQQAVQNATSWITGGKGGYVIFQLNANGQPEEILILDQPSIETAQNVWRWNQGGFGHSSAGYNGPYTTAITQDGAIVADFITAGTMLANIIHGGTLTLGGQGNGNGQMIILNASGNKVAGMDSTGLYAQAGQIAGWKIGASDIFKTIDLYADMSEDGLADVGDNDPVQYWVWMRAPTAANTACFVTAYKRKSDYLSGNNVVYTNFSARADGNVRMTDADILGGTLKVGSLFSVDNQGNVVANSLKSNNAIITGGELNIKSKTERQVNITLKYDNGGNANTETTIGAFGFESLDVNGLVYASTTFQTLECGDAFQTDYGLTGRSSNFQAKSNGQVKSVYTYNDITTSPANMVVDNGGYFCRSSSSSKRYKKNISEKIADSLNPERLYEVPVKSFKYRKGYLHEGDPRENTEIIGLIVEDLEEKYPCAVEYDAEGNPEMWNAQILVPAMLKLIQEQNDRIKELEEKLK